MRMTRREGNTEVTSLNVEERTGPDVQGDTLTLDKSMNSNYRIYGNRVCECRW